MINLIFQLDFWISLVVLTLLELTLSADNIIFIVSVSSRLPKTQQDLARKLGLIVAALSRFILLSALFFASNLKAPLFHIGTFSVAIHNIVLVLGGIFLIINPLLEIYELRVIKEAVKPKNHAQLGRVVLQIMFVDIVFSIDNVITAIGVATSLITIICAIVIATFFMLIASTLLSHFIERHPKSKVIGLCFLVLIGIILVIRGFGFDISSAYLYVAFLFSIFTQIILAYTRY